MTVSVLCYVAVIAAVVLAGAARFLDRRTAVLAGLVLLLWLLYVGTLSVLVSSPTRNGARRELCSLSFR